MFFDTKSKQKTHSSRILNTLWMGRDWHETESAYHFTAVAKFVLHFLLFAEDPLNYTYSTILFFPCEENNYVVWRACRRKIINLMIKLHKIYLAGYMFTQTMDDFWQLHWQLWDRKSFHSLSIYLHNIVCFLM